METEAWWRTARAARRVGETDNDRLHERQKRRYTGTGGMSSASFRSIHMKSKLFCIVSVMISLAGPALANDPPAHDEKHEKDKKAKKEGEKKDDHDEHGKDAKKDEKKEHPKP
jgi:hypothetical protein